MDTLASTPIQPARRALVNVKLNLRSGPGLGFERIGRLEPGQAMKVNRVVEGESFLGRSTWFGVEGLEHYFWSNGALLEDEPPPPPPAPGPGAPQVKRRANQTILPLKPAELADVFGRFGTAPARGGMVTITPDSWVRENIVDFSHPVLQSVRVRATSLNRLAIPHFQAVFDEIEARGLAHLIQTFDGGWCPRHIGSKPSNPLSSHTWGVAIDLNSRWNGYGDQPALPGQPGHLEPLVPIFNAHGFAWGGHFSPQFLDGMHFELARFNP